MPDDDAVGIELEVEVGLPRPVRHAHDELGGASGDTMTLVGEGGGDGESEDREAHPA